MVMIITLIFRIRNEDLGGEVIRLLGLTADHHFYSKVLEVLLVFTTLPIIVVLAKPSSAERAQRAIASLAKKDPISLEQAATTPEARDRIRVAAITVMRQSTISRALSRAVSNNTSVPPTTQRIFEQIDSRSAPAGKISAEEVTAWWQAAEPPDIAKIDDGAVQQAASYSRLDTVNSMLAQLCDPDGQMDCEDFEYLLECVLREDYEVVSDTPAGRDYFVRKMNRKTMWALPGVDEWLAQLHNATPPQLKCSSAESPATTVGMDAPFVQQNIDVEDAGATQGVEDNPLFQQQGEQPLAQQDDEWQQRPSDDEHDGRVYWFNSRTRQTQWERPNGVAESGGARTQRPLSSSFEREQQRALEPEPEPEVNRVSRRRAHRPLPSLEGVEGRVNTAAKLRPRRRQATTVANNASLEQIRAILRALVQNKQGLSANDQAAQLEVVETENDRDILLEVCVDEGINVLPPDVVVAAEIFQQVDADRSGKISFEEFSVWWSERQLATQGALNEDTMVEMRRVWDECDEDGNGQLDLDEFVAVLNKVAESEWRRAVDASSGRPYLYHKVTKETRWVETDSAAQVTEFLKRQGIDLEKKAFAL